MFVDTHAHLDFPDYDGDKEEVIRRAREAGIFHIIDVGIDVLNMQQPRAYGIEELGRRFAGKVCFLTTADIQATMPSGDAERIRHEVRQLVECWSTRDGGLIVFNYGFDEAIGTTPEATRLMFKEFERLMYHWSQQPSP